MQCKKKTSSKSTPVKVPSDLPYSYNTLLVNAFLEHSFILYQLLQNSYMIFVFDSFFIFIGYIFLSVLIVKTTFYIVFFVSKIEM